MLVFAKEKKELKPGKMVGAIRGVKCRTVSESRILNPAQSLPARIHRKALNEHFGVVSENQITQRRGIEWNKTSHKYKYKCYGRQKFGKIFFVTPPQAVVRYSFSFFLYTLFSRSFGSLTVSRARCLGKSRILPFATSYKTRNETSKFSYTPAKKPFRRVTI